MRQLFSLVLLGLLTCAGMAQRPSILLCIADDISAPHMSAYGCTWVETPNFDRVANEGVLFTQAFTPNAKCAPSRACLLIGRNPWQLGAAMNHHCYFPAEYRTFMEVMAAAGYATGFTGKGWAPGDPGQIDGSPRRLTGMAYQQQRLVPPTSGISDIDYAANFEAFLAEKPRNQPFCFWYGALEPHRDYAFGSGVAQGGKRLDQIDRVPGYWPDNDTVRHDMLDYALEIEHFDAHLGRMLALLAARGELDHTLVVVLADHGMPFPRVKGQAYPASNQIPLAMMWPGRLPAAPHPQTAIVSTVDVTATLLDAAGIDAGEAGMQPLSGSSLLPLLRGEAAPARTYMVVGKERHDIGRPHDAGYPIRAIFRDSLLYIHQFEPDRWPQGNPETGYLNCDGGPTKTWLIDHWNTPGLATYWQQNLGKRPQEELYDLRRDPDCLHNLAAAPAYQLLKQDMQRQMVAFLRDEGDRRMYGRGHEYETYPYSDERHRDYYGKLMRGEKPPWTGWVSPGDVHLLAD